MRQTSLTLVEMAVVVAIVAIVVAIAAPLLRDFQSRARIAEVPLVLNGVAQAGAAYLATNTESLGMDETGLLMGATYWPDNAPSTRTRPWDPSAGCTGDGTGTTGGGGSDPPADDGGGTVLIPVTGGEEALDDGSGSTDPSSGDSKDCGATLPPVFSVIGFAPDGDVRGSYFAWTGFRVESVNGVTTDHAIVQVSAVTDVDGDGVFPYFGGGSKDGAFGMAGLGETKCTDGYILHPGASGEVLYVGTCY